MQDRCRQLDENLLRRTAGPYIRVNLRRSGRLSSSQLMVPEADMLECPYDSPVIPETNSSTSFDYLVGAGK